jgi:hypothetical protein
MNNMRLGLLVTLIMLSTILVPSTIAASYRRCRVGVAANSDENTLETDALHDALDDFGITWVDITDVPVFGESDVQCIIVRYAGDDLSVPDLETWVNAGGGLIQLGDWSDYFPNDWEYVAINTTIPITLVTAFPGLTDGLISGWTAYGFYCYGWDSSDAVGWVTDTGYTNIVNADGYDRACTAAEVGSGRAVYIGWNVYGPKADANSLRLFENALRWVCPCNIVGGEIIPVNTVELIAPAMIILVLVVGTTGVLYKKRTP